MRTFMTNLMRQQQGELVEEPVRSEPSPVIDMVDDASVTSEFSYLTGDSEGHSTFALSNVQVAMAPTLTLHPTAPVRKVVVTPKETVGGAQPGASHRAHCHHTP